MFKARKIHPTTKKILDELVGNLDSPFWKYDLKNLITRDGEIIVRPMNQSKDGQSAEYQEGNDEEDLFNNSKQSKFNRLLQRFGSDFLKYLRRKSPKIASKLGFRMTSKLKRSLGFRKNKPTIKDIVRKFSNVEKKDDSLNLVFNKFRKRQRRK